MQTTSILIKILIWAIIYPEATLLLPQQNLGAILRLDLEHQKMKNNRLN